MKGEMIFTFTGNTTAILTKDCQLLINICAHLKPYRTARLKSTITKGDMKFNDIEIDFCEYLGKNNKRFTDAHKNSGLTLRCPFESVSF